ncbi:protein kinase domain-containing protein [Apiospora sp. TS-2023a]
MSSDFLSKIKCALCHQGGDVDSNGRIYVDHKLGVVPTTEERLALEKQERVYEELDEGRGHLYEPVERYRPGGYYPVQISLLGYRRHEPNIREVYIQDRYHVINKVDHSPFSTTWLCHDRDENKWRCLEINVASESSGHSPEQLIRNTLLEQGVDRKTARKHGIVLPYHTFYIQSTNGRHLVSILPLLGPTLTQIQDMNQLDGDRRREICQSMAQSLDYLHSQGICHGNFHPGNVRVWLKEGAFDDYSPKEIWRVVGFPSGDRLKRKREYTHSSSHAPESVYEVFNWYRMNTPAEMQEHLTTEVAIVDRGGAYLLTNDLTDDLTDDPPRNLRTPHHYQAPECIMSYAEMGTKVDIWALAASIVHVVVDVDMFYATDDDVETLTMIEELIGPMPDMYWETAAEVFLMFCMQQWEKYGKVKGSPRPAIPDAKNRRLHTVSHMVKSGNELEKRIKVDGSYEDTIEDRLREPQALRGGRRWNGHFCGAWYLDPNEVTCLGGLLREMLKWDPDERWDIKAVLGHEWFANNRYTPRLKPNSYFIPPEKNPSRKAKYMPWSTMEKSKSKKRVNSLTIKIMACVVFLLLLFCIGWFGVSARPHPAEPPVEPAPMPELDFELLLFVVPG